MPHSRDSMAASGSAFYGRFNATVLSYAAWLWMPLLLTHYRRDGIDGWGLEFWL